MPHVSYASPKTLDPALEMTLARARTRWQEASAALDADSIRVIHGGAADASIRGALESALASARQEYEAACDSCLRQMAR